MALFNFTRSAGLEQRKNISSNLLQDDYFSNFTDLNVPLDEDPTVVASSYMIYKIGENWVFPILY